MKKVKFFLASTALVLAIGATYAVKAHSSFGDGNVWYIDGSSTCVVDANCKLTTGSPDECTDQPQFYQSNIGGVCTTALDPSQTLVTTK